MNCGMGIELGVICRNKLPKMYGMAEVTTGSWSAGTAAVLKKDGDRKTKNMVRRGARAWDVAFLSHGVNWEISSRCDGGVWRGMI